MFGGEMAGGLVSHSLSHYSCFDDAVEASQGVQPPPPKKGRAVHDTSSQDQQQPTVQNQHYINIFLSSMRNKSDRKCVF